jgi:hypothetical protein
VVFDEANFTNAFLQINVDHFEKLTQWDNANLPPILNRSATPSMIGQCCYGKNLSTSY